MLTPEGIKTILQDYQDPYLGSDLISIKAVKNIEVKENQIKIEILLGYPVDKNNFVKQLKEFLLPQLGNMSLEVIIHCKIEAYTVQPGPSAISGVKNTIAIASGKGGVGKSTTTVNLALALAQLGARVGILDADIYGPNQPQMLGITEQPEATVDKKFKPLVRYQVQSMSIGYLVERDTAMIWRGPMVSTALQQLLRDTLWDDLDYLLIDLPPGTGDIQLTLAQKIPVTGAIIVTTPQDIALLDARKAYTMFQKVKIPVLGLVENMSTHVCSQCGHEEAIFGSGGGERMAQEYSLELLGKLPLAKAIRERADSGCPIVEGEPQSALAQVYREIAQKAAAKLSLQGKNYAAKFPKIVIE